MYIIDDICYAGEATPDIKIKEATVLRGGMLLLTFSTGEQRIFDTTRLTGSAFLPLRNEKILSDFKIFHGVMTPTCLIVVIKYFLISFHGFNQIQKSIYFFLRKTGQVYFLFAFYP